MIRRFTGTYSNYVQKVRSNYQEPDFFFWVFVCCIWDSVDGDKIEDRGFIEVRAKSVRGRITLSTVCNNSIEQQSSQPFQHLNGNTSWFHLGVGTYLRIMQQNLCLLIHFTINCCKYVFKRSL